VHCDDVGRALRLLRLRRLRRPFVDMLEYVACVLDVFKVFDQLSHTDGRRPLVGAARPTRGRRQLE
tara:strand:+ start:218 stop:415 length:198 start_codon:yes stop_codon:yes gene_type:complete